MPVDSFNDAPLRKMRGSEGNNYQNNWDFGVRYHMTCENETVLLAVPQRA